MNGFWLYQAAFLLEVAAVLFFAAYWLAPRRWVASCGLLLLSAGVVAHSLFFAATWSRQGALPLATNFESLSFSLLVSAWVLLALEWRHRLAILGSFLLPILVLFMLMGFRFAKLPEPVHAALSGGFLAWHVAFSMTAYMLFTTASGVGLAYLVQERQLKSGHPGRVAYELPPLVKLESLAAGCASAGLLLLTLGLLAGMAWSRSALATFWVWDAKSVFGLGVWLLYLSYLVLRRNGKWRGRLTTRLLLAGFLAIFFGYYLVNVYGGGHRFL